MSLKLVLRVAAAVLLPLMLALTGACLSNI